VAKRSARHPATSHSIRSPYDLDAHYAKKNTVRWFGCTLLLHRDVRRGNAKMITGATSPTAIE